MPIRQLSETIVNRIAAGEVIERPASVVKELVENALDAGARRIEIATAGGGKTLLRVIDDGGGIPAGELPLAVARHCTSKLDGGIDDIRTLGFRGEALPSIGSVARLTIRSRPPEADGAAEIIVDAGRVDGPRPSPGNRGTLVEVRDLFHATPARLKFLKSDRAETGAITEVVKRIAIAFPAVRFSLSGPDRTALDFVPQKWHPAALVQYLQEPGRDHAATRMPDFRLPRDEAEQLAAFLLQRAQPAAPLPATRGDAERGRHVAQQVGCVFCHAIDVPVGSPRAPQLANLDADRGCLAAQPAARAPAHGFDAAQRADLRAFLPFATTAPWHPSPIDFGARERQALRCPACHALDGVPSAWALWARAASAEQPLPVPHDPIAQAVPALTWVGAKLQPSWLRRFVRGEEPSPRPWLHARMPAFGARGVAVVDGLLREHGWGGADEPPVAADAQMAIHGERLLAMGKGFGCVQCHALGDQPAVQAFEREGIELLTARRRLRHQYYSRWWLDPMRLDPDARMPRFADAKGRTALTEVLGGDAAQQFEAIWQHLGSRLPQPR